MHKHPHKIDWPRTLEARKSGEFQSRHSYYSQRIHPDGDWQCKYLAGEDMSQQRLRVLEFYGNRCEKQGSGECEGPLEIDHFRGGRKAERCSCLANLQVLCKRHHRLKHGRFIRNPKGE